MPLAVVVGVNLLMSLFVSPRLDASYLADEAWGSTSLSAVGGVWAVVTALAAAIIILIAVNYRRLPALRASMDAGANAPALPVLSVASLVGFGSVVAALPAFAMVRDWVLGIEGAGREHLDNLIFVVNCNLQRLDGPVRGNSKISTVLSWAEEIGPHYHR